MKKTFPILKVGKRVSLFCSFLNEYGDLSHLAARDFSVGFAEKLASLLNDDVWEKAILSGHDAADLAIDRIVTDFKKLRRKRKSK